MCTAVQDFEAFLDSKAEQHANLKKYDVTVLLTSRLAPDQHDFIAQVQFACDYVRFGASRLSGQDPPKWEDNEKTVAEVRARVQNTIAFAQSIKECQYEDAAKRVVSVNWAPGKTIRGNDYLLQLTIPNTYFHLTTAYAILRHNGVELGKMDFLGVLALT